jgi:hypothetical protein
MVHSTLKKWRGDAVDAMVEADEADEQDLVAALLAATNDPAEFVSLAWPGITPEAWQLRVLQTVGDQLAENAQLNRWKAVQIATASGNGVGKSALLSWLILWGMMTFENTLSVVSAGSEGQLRTRLWGELSKWHSQLPKALREKFTLTATSLFAAAAERTWRCDARPWTERNQEAFSGLHNYGKRVLMVFDECSMIPTSIWRASDAMLSDAETQIIWCVFGNPTRIDGRFPMCFPGGKFAASWTSFRVDSREVSLTDKTAIQEKLNFYGPTSNYARSHVYGEFPLATATQLIPVDVVEAAALREFFVHPTDPVILGCDVASGHGEDSSVIYIRQGLDGRSHPPRKFPGLDPIQFSYKIAACANELNAQGIFIDSGGVGEGTAARLRELGMPVFPIYFGSKSDNPDGITRCANKRSEMWCRMAQWLKAGAIVNDAELKAQLCGPEYGENAMGLVLERKEHMKERGLASPDCADSLALTFALPIWGHQGMAGPGDHQVSHEYNPFSDDVMAGRPIPELTRRYVAPGWPSLKSDEWSHDDLADAMASDRLRWANEEENWGGS